MVVAIGIDEAIHFCPEEDFDVGALDDEDKRRLLALGTTSKDNENNNAIKNIYGKLHFSRKDEILLNEIDNVSCKDIKEDTEEVSWKQKQQYGKIK